ncbi:flagellar hook-length control protein FliK [Sulfurimonas sp.]
MMLLDVQQESSAPTSTLIVTPKEESKGTLSFSDLLRKVGEKSDEKIIQKSGFVLSLDDVKKENTKSSKNETLVSLLNSDDTNSVEEELVELNPKLTSSLSKEELKPLIAQAKEFLKDKIVKSEGFKRSEIESLPKTLKGLSAVAKKIGIDVSKITLEEVQASKKSLNVEPKQSKKDLLQTQEVNDDGLLVKKESHLSKEKVTLKAQDGNVQESISNENLKEESKQDTKQRTKTAQTTTALKSTPLFKAQTNSEITTQQLVNSKISNTLESKNPKQKADETLQLLLRGEKTLKSNNALTTDFSVATAKVIAPSAINENSKALESLLRGESSIEIPKESKNESKIDGLNVAKADSFEVKLHEAKQMVKYLSADVKSAIEDYKAPFTRVKVQLNPQRFGEIDLTIVQRGKNLHINLSSNNAAINTLALNASDLKVQLQNSGINNASLNFSNNSQEGANGGQAQHQQQQHGQKAQQEYNYFDAQDENEEILSSLEIVVPNYA